jgi:hypothetical protein
MSTTYIPLIHFICSGLILLKWFRLARKELPNHELAVAGLEHGVAKEVLAQWKAMVAAWISDKSKPDPYSEPPASTLYYYLQFPSENSNYMPN